MAAAANGTSNPSGGEQRGMSPGEGLKWSWLLWFVMLAVSAGAAGTAMLVSAPSPDQAGQDRTAVAPGLIFNMVIFAVLIPLGFVAHWKVFRAYWKAGTVQPKGYVLASFLLWLAIMLVVVIVSVSIMVQHVFMPDGLLVLIAIVLQLLSWPGGWAMVEKRSLAEEDDEEVLHLPED